MMELWSFDPSAAAYNQLALQNEKIISVEYSVTDNDNASATNTFDIHIAGSNDDPVSSDAVVELTGASEDNLFVISVADLLAPYSDHDTGDTIRVEGLTPYQAKMDDAGTYERDADNNFVPSTILAGSVVLTEADGEDVYEFVPVDNFNGKVYLSYTVADGNGPGLRVHTVSLTVDAVQDDPSLGKLEGDGLFLGEIQEDTTRVLTEAELLEFYVDVDGDTLSIVDGSVSSPNGTITINDDGNYVFTPTEHFFGSTQISFTITDSASDSEDITVEKFLKVLAVNDAPLISLPIDVSSEYVSDRSADLQSAFATAPTKQASFSMAAGFERFFTLSDFGYSDQEVTTMHSRSYSST